MQARELRLEVAIGESAATGKRLEQLAAGQRQSHSGDAGTYLTTRHWEASAGTYCYLTHVTAPDQAPERLELLANILYRQASLPSQPWYPQFLGGKSNPVEQVPPTGVSAHQMAIGQFDLGLPTPRWYRQLVSLARPHKDTAVIIARSITTGPALPDRARLAYTLAPNGEVLHWENGQLHWHHICCTPGAGVLPGRLDRWLINGLRRTGMDRAERDTYRQEAEQWRDWLAGDIEAFARAHLPI